MIKITDAAKEKIIDVLISEKATAIRFGLQGGGCSGFQYYFSIAEEFADDDIEINIADGYTMLVDAISTMYLENAEIDYKQDLMGETFVFNNPAASNTCGCGSSVTFE